MNLFGIGAGSKADLTSFGLDNNIDAKAAEKELDDAIKSASIAGHNNTEKEAALKKAKALIDHLDSDANKGRFWVRVAKLESNQEAKQSALNTARFLLTDATSNIDFLRLRDIARMEKEMNSDTSSTIHVMERVAAATVKSNSSGFLVMINRLEEAAGCWIALTEFTDNPSKKLEYLKHAKQAYSRIRPSASTVGFLLAVAQAEKKIDPAIAKKTEEKANSQAERLITKFSQSTTVVV